MRYSKPSSRRPRGRGLEGPDRTLASCGICYKVYDEDELAPERRRFSFCEKEGKDPIEEILVCEGCIGDIDDGVGAGS